MKLRRPEGVGDKPEAMDYGRVADQPPTIGHGTSVLWAFSRQVAGMGFYVGIPIRTFSEWWTIRSEHAISHPG